MAPCRAVLLTSLFLTLPLVAGAAEPGKATEPGKVTGSFTVEGKTFTPDNVYAVLAPGAYDKKTKDVLVIFTVKPREKNEILTFGSGGPGGTDLTVRLGEGPEFRPGLSVINFTYHVKGASMREDKYRSSSGADGTVFEKKTFDPQKKGRVAGKIRSSEKSEGKEVLTSDLEFDVPILGEHTE